MLPRIFWKVVTEVVGLRHVVAAGTDDACVGVRTRLLEVIVVKVTVAPDVLVKKSIQRMNRSLWARRPCGRR